jgi:hypothetical protein
MSEVLFERMKPKRILVEGISGSGKSTTSQWLNLTLARSLPTAWYPEDGEPGGLRCYYDPEKQSVEEYGNTLVSRWADFLTESFLEEGTWIVESALLMSPIHGLLLRDVDTRAIEATVDRLFAVVSSVESCLIYLRPDDPGEAIRRACGVRYEGLLEEYVQRVERSRYGIQHGLSGFEGLVTYWEHFCGISDQLVARFEGAKIVVRTYGGDREPARRIICDFLSHCGFSFPATAEREVLSSELSRYAGIYTRNLEGRTAEIEIGIVEGELVIFGLAPYLWDAGERLIAREPGIFAAASWPTEVRFQAREGTVTSFRLVTVAGGRATDEVFPRVGLAKI